MTALDMVGFSLSVLRLSDSMLARLDAPCSAPAWPGGGRINRARIVPAPALPSGVGGSLASLVPPAGALCLDAAQAAAVASAIRAAAEALIAGEKQLTAWDEVAGDGDCGTTLTAGATAVLADVSSYALTHPATTALGLALSVGRSMGGSSGALYSIFLNAVAGALMDSPPSVAAAAAAFASGCAAMMHYGGASRGNRTMLDALIPAAEAIDRVAVAGGTMAAALAAAADAAEAGAEATRTMSAGAGRASYVPQKTVAAVPDPGAKGVAFWLRALAMSADEPSLRLSAAGSE